MTSAAKLYFQAKHLIKLVQISSYIFLRGLQSYHALVNLLNIGSKFKLLDKIVNWSPS